MFFCVAWAEGHHNTGGCYWRADWRGDSWRDRSLHWRPSSYNGRQGKAGLSETEHFRAALRVERSSKSETTPTQVSERECDEEFIERNGRGRGTCTEVHSRGSIRGNKFCVVCIYCVWSTNVRLYSCILYTENVCGITQKLPFRKGWKLWPTQVLFFTIG